MFNRFKKVLLLIIFAAFILAFPSFTHAAEYTGFSVQFDVQPRLIQNNTAVQLRITFKGNVVNQYSLNQYCSGGTLNAVVVMPLDTNQTDTYGTDDYGQTAIFRNNVQASGISNPVGISSLRSAQQINWDFNQNYTHGSAANYRLFQAIVTCGGKEVARSSIVQINVSNQPVGGGGTGTGTGIGCGTSGQPACKSGETQTYPFEITNPLKGGANDFTSLVKIIAQWIFNLAIPIAVAMIVYAGILFLTAAGEPAKVTKAKEVLKYAVIGLAIILIGSGFVTLIQSILELGGTGQQTEQGPVGPGPVYGPPAPGVVGNKCSKDSNCFTGLKCKNTICQRPTGNWVCEPCA